MNKMKNNKVVKDFDYYLDIKGTAIDGNYAGTFSSSLYTELKGWVGLSVLSLAIAGSMALFIAFLRVPFAQNFLDFDTQGIFEKGLITHVTFAFVIWYFGIHGALTILVSGKKGPSKKNNSFLGFIALFFAYLSIPLLLIPGLINLGLPSPNNYVPILIHPVFIMGLASLTVALVLIVLRLLINVSFDTKCESVKFGIASAGLIFFIALSCLGISWLKMEPDLNSLERAEQAFWGMGHVLQFANTLLMFVSIHLLTRMNLGITPLSDKGFKMISCLMVAGASIGPMIYFSFAANSSDQLNAFTSLYWYVMPLPLGIFFFYFIFLLVRRAISFRYQTPETIGLWITMILFSLGGLIGFFGGYSDTRTPAHYHAMLVAVTLVFMCLNFGLFFPILNSKIPRASLRLSTYFLLGFGQLLHSSGLYWAGLYGSARKVSVGTQIFENPNEIIFLTLMGFGGFMAVLGGVLYIVMSIYCFVKVPKESDQNKIAVV